MDDQSYIEHKKRLEELCTIMIDALDKLKSSGAISQEEYNRHVEMKKHFLNNTTCK